MRRLFLLLLAPALLAPASAQVIISPPELVSINAAGTATGGGSSRMDSGEDVGAVSADGRYILFQSTAVDLTPLLDSNDRDDFYVRDLVSETTELVSLNADETGAGNDYAIWGALAADQPIVVFESRASDLAPGVTDANGTTDVFARDIASGVTELISLDQAGTGTPNSISRRPRLSRDGRYIFYFTTRVDELIGVVDGNTTDFDLVVHDREVGSTELVNVNADGTASGERGLRFLTCSLSDDARTVAFESVAGDLVSPAIPTGQSRVYVRDLEAGATELISIDVNGAPAQGGNPIVSADGRFVLYLGFGQHTAAPIPDPVGARAHIYLHDRHDGTTLPVDVRSDGTAHGDSGEVQILSMTPDGAFVFFRSDAPDLLPGVNPDGRLAMYRYDRANAELELVSVNSGGVETVNATVSSNAAVSADGRLVAFRTKATDVISGLTDTNDEQDLFLRDMESGQTRLITWNVDGSATGDDESDEIRMNRAGTLLAFQSNATDLVSLPNVNGTNNDIFFVRIDACIDRTDVAELVSRLRSGSAHRGFDDFNQDGALNIADARALALQCTNARCAPCP